jgi:hypothetical protein
VTHLSIVVFKVYSLVFFAQFRFRQCSAVQCSAVQCSAVQCSAVQCSAMVEFFAELMVYKSEKRSSHIAENHMILCPLNGGHLKERWNLSLYKARITLTSGTAICERKKKTNLKTAFAAAVSGTGNLSTASICLEMSSMPEPRLLLIACLVAQLVVWKGPSRLLLKVVLV